MAMISFLKKRVELIIILLLVLLISAIWIWYGIRLKEIEQQKEGAYIFNQTANML
jgi:4-hydroxybenzoate polyprenyltransferase